MPYVFPRVALRYGKDGQCGNGARCFAAWRVRVSAATVYRFTIESPSGTHAVERLADGHYCVSMGVTQFAPQAVPMVGFDETQDEYALDLGGPDVDRREV